MLYIVTNAGTTGWHTEDPVPRFHKQEKIFEVQADGDELMYIKENFNHVPMPKHQSVVRWFGDMAAFIANNL
jgi:hypothetical protein